MMNEDESRDARKKMIDVATNGEDDEIERLSSAIHLGLQVMGMIESLGDTREQIAAMGLDPNEGNLVSSTIIGHRESGGLFRLSVTSATEDDVESHKAMLAKVQDLDEVATRH